MLITLLVYVLAFCLIYWLITSVIPMPAPFRTIALVVFALLVLVALFDLLAGGTLGLPRLR